MIFEHGRPEPVDVAADIAAAGIGLFHSPPDTGGSGSAEGSDIFASRSSWFAGNVALANHQQDCRVHVEDMFACLSDWFAGCS